MLTGCGPRRRASTPPPTRAPDDRVGPLLIFWCGADAAPIAPPAHAADLLARLSQTFSGFCADFAWSSPPPVETHVYVGLRSGVPCGIPNGGGCYTLWSGLHLAEDPPAGAEWVWRHEFNHYRLHALGGDLDSDHGDPSWAHLR